MSRLIDADALLLALDKRKTYELADGRNRAYGKGVRDAMKDVGKQPTVDAISVVHGKWVLNENDDMFYCTNCKNGSVRNDYPYCHWCGAKMDEPTQFNNSNTLDALGEKVKE